MDPNLQMSLDAIPYPAYAAMSDWTVAASNRAVTVVFHEYSSNPGGRINALRLVFSDPVDRKITVNWEQQAQDTLALFRATIPPQRRRDVAQGSRS